jgi:4-hydroxybenzoate polyprenyltransferase
MGIEWQEAGWGQRTVFVIAAIYWMAMLALAVASLPAARSAAEITLVLGFYLVALLYALVIRVAYVAVSRRRPRPRVRSWWVLVVGALLGILVTVARITAPTA